MLYIRCCTQTHKIQWGRAEYITWFVLCWANRGVRVTTTNDDGADRGHGSSSYIYRTNTARVRPVIQKRKRANFRAPRMWRWRTGDERSWLSINSRGRALALPRLPSYSMASAFVRFLAQRTTTIAVRRQPKLQVSQHCCLWRQQKPKIHNESNELYIAQLHCYIISHSAHAHIRLIIMKMQPASKRMNDDDENEIFGYNFLYASKSWLGWCSMCVGKGETADVPWRKLPIYVLCSTCTTTVDEAMTSADIIIAGAQLKCWMKIAWFPHNRLLCHYLDCLVGCICDDGGGDSVALMQFVHDLGSPFHHAIYYFGILDWTGTWVASTAHRNVNVSRWWGLSFSRPPHLLPNKKKRRKNAVADPSHGYDIENIEKDVVVICCAKCCFSDANIIFHWLLEIWLTAILREFRSFAPCSISVEVSNFCVSSSSFCTFAMKRRPKRRWMNADCCSSGLTHIHHTHTHLMRERDVQKLPKRLNKFVE